MVPVALRWLLAVVAFFALAWALLVPPFQAPDEDVHLGYLQSLVDGHRLPGSVPGASQISTEALIARVLANTQDTIFHPDTQPAAGKAPEAAAATQLPGTPKEDGLGTSNVSGTPPAAYAVLAVGYRLAGGNIYDRLYAARVVSALMMLITTVGAWLLAGELFDRRRMPQLLCAATTGLWPMAMFVTSSVNVDGTLIAEWSIIAWLGVRILRRGITPASALALGVVTGLALLTKATSLALLPALGLLVVLGVRGAWRTDRRRTLISLGCLVLPILLLEAGWILATRGADRAAYGQVRAATGAPGASFDLREFLVYLWEFYLPPLPFMQDARSLSPVIADLPVYNTWLGGTWGVYGWVNVWFPHWTYAIFAGITLVVAAAFATQVVRRRGVLRAAVGGWGTPAFLLTMALSLLAGVHLTDYRLAAQGQLFAQGRYLLPLLPLFGLVVAGAHQVAGRGRTVVAATWLGGLVAFQLASLGLVVSRFYG